MLLAQLTELLRASNPKCIYDLYLPYLPYGRQDKEVSNSTTFALQTFINLINSLKFETVTVLDAHNPKALPKDWINNIPNRSIARAIELSGATMICFPDKGASQRGYTTKDLPSFSLEKTRNQRTGEITGLKLIEDMNVKGHNILIVDDICDRGGTFIASAKLLDSLGVSNVYLYTTHGLYSGGTNIIIDSSIRKIFNFNGEVKDRT